MSDAISPDERTNISDEQFRQLRATARPYTAVILHPGPNRHAEGADAIMAADPAVQARVTYELHPVRSFPGSTLPG